MNRRGICRTFIFDSVLPMSFYTFGVKLLLACGKIDYHRNPDLSENDLFYKIYITTANISFIVAKIERIR